MCLENAENFKQVFHLIDMQALIPAHTTLKKWGIINRNKRNVERPSNEFQLLL